MPQVVSITQNTELGTLYTPDEIRAICDHAHERGMKVHLDGARIANAAAAAGRADARRSPTPSASTSSPSAAPRTALLFGEAVVVLNPDAVRAMKHLRKLSMQLASKMRFVSVQLEALLAGDLWLRNARHANAMAAAPRRRASAPCDGVEILLPRPGQRRLRPAAARRERAAAEALPLLLLGRGGRRRALDVLLRHHRGRRRRLRGGAEGGDGPL